MEESSSSFRDRLAGNICQFDYLLYIAFIFEIVLFLFATIAFLFGNLDAEAQTILYLDFILLGIVIMGTVGLLRMCNREQ